MFRKINPFYIREQPIFREKSEQKFLKFPEKKNAIAFLI